MKKVLKKFNRTLSIMLAAAMVLTTVPQTALPVQAEEATEASLDTASEGTEEVTPGSDETKESEETTETKEPADGEGESNEGSSEVTTPADGENENGEDETGDNSDDSVTPRRGSGHRES